MGRQAGLLPITEVSNGYVDTWNIGGDRFAFLPKSMFNPLGFLGSTNPGVTAVLSVPPTYDQMPIGGVGMSTGSYGSYAGAANPWSPRDSIVPWVLGALLIGWFGVHRLYYHKEKR